MTLHVALATSSPKTQKANLRQRRQPRRRRPTCGSTTPTRRSEFDSRSQKQFQELKFPGEEDEREIDLERGLPRTLTLVNFPPALDGEQRYCMQCDYTAAKKDTTCAPAAARSIVWFSCSLPSAPDVVHHRTKVMAKELTPQPCSRQLGRKLPELCG